VPAIGDMRAGTLHERVSERVVNDDHRDPTDELPFVIDASVERKIPNKNFIAHQLTSNANRIKIRLKYKTMTNTQRIKNRIPPSYNPGLQLV
jgi:hypothetical protein